ncbi:hypothetical protein GE061_009780 [Apolygus lucorum]|uniref:Uncharacterized protein n=1 Tax=Apolygus lucorum TaxID=248454 RepID=A0A6A4KH33_APOLU|nr:hypothetical protein GE061_009780 [Apolygus lucorum]
MSSCQQYYVCKELNSVVHRSCPAGTYYSPTSQDCKVGGSCYDIVCTGRVDGRYPDTTEGCTRSFEMKELQR